MESYSKNDDYSIDIEVESLIENEFGDFQINDDGFYVVSDPDHSVLENVKIKIEDDTVMLDIEEVSLEVARESGVISEAESAVKSKNRVLKSLTGRSVEDRKKDLRQSVINEEATETSIEFDNS